MRSFAGFICVTFLLILSIQADNYDYGLMIDAGSSGSRIYIYVWPHRTSDTLPQLNTYPLKQVPQPSKKVSPGLSTFANNVSAIADYLQPLMDFAETSLQTVSMDVDLSSVVLFLKATGGLRALSEADQNNIITATANFLSTTKFNFKKEWALVIPLDQEALYGWITVNYLTETLQNDLDGKHMYGALDMGGETTEISFVPDVPALVNDNEVELGEQTYHVYTGGYTGHGQDASLRATYELLAASTTEGGTLPHPCLLTNYTTPPYQASNTFSYYFSGTGNATACSQLVHAALLNTSVPCNISSCPFDGQYQPTLKGNFFAFSGFFYTFQFYFPDKANVTTNQGVSIQDIIDKKDAFCNMTFQEANSTYNTSVNSNVFVYCFTGTYYTEILKAYGFNASSYDVTFASMINGAELSWALGAMLQEADLLPFLPPSNKSRISGWEWAIMFIGFFGVLVVVGIYVMRRVRARKAKTYSRVALDF